MSASGLGLALSAESQLKNRPKFDLSVSPWGGRGQVGLSVGGRFSDSKPARAARLQSRVDRSRTTLVPIRLRALVLSAALLIACRSEPRTMQVEIAVGGMTCDSCVQAITHELGRLEGVESVKVDLEGGTAVVTYKEGAIDPATLEAEIEKIGYDAEPGSATVVEGAAK